ncbi:uncharacterized protein LOC121370773 [Gigantopelta aegis]|uniref:uncharacterized protein LOC121370773 n=1 Tax=Gigantopelta aegis TaxID=1735272 RepID=UPI001B8886CF|nr:uncharacterized protein LOC121370773 [Gigantopelta aegis]
MKESNEEIRAEVLEEDKKKDMGVYITMIVAVLATAASITGASAVIMLRMLGFYRDTIGGYWMSCIPFIFPAVTGVSVAFKRQMIAIALHVPILLMASLSGGVSFGYSISPVFDTSVNCTKHILDGDCEKTSLVYLYTAFGGVACGLSVLGILISSCACQQARRRLQKKADRLELNQQRDANIKAHQNESIPKHKSMLSSTNGLAPKSGETNGVHKTSDHVYANQVALTDDLTTKL